MGKSPPSYQESIQKRNAISLNVNNTSLNTSNNSHTSLMNNHNLDKIANKSNNNIYGLLSNGDASYNKNIAYENSLYELNPTSYLQNVEVPPASSKIPQHATKTNNLNDSSSSSAASLSYPFMRNLLNEFNSQSSSSSSTSSNANSLNNNSSTRRLPTSSNSSNSNLIVNANNIESPVPPAYVNKQQPPIKHSHQHLHTLQPPQPSPIPLAYNFPHQMYSPALSSNSSLKQHNNDIESEFANLTLSIEREIEKHKSVSNEYYGQCYKCGKGVHGRNEACQAMGNIYHSSCFTCISCSRTLRGKSFYNINNQIYCEEDYLVIFCFINLF